MPEVNKISDEEWDKPMVCPIDPKELAECEACQQIYSQKQKKYPN